MELLLRRRRITRFLVSLKTAGENRELLKKKAGQARICSQMVFEEEALRR